jgi:hypothetical protein
LQSIGFLEKLKTETVLEFYPGLEFSLESLLSIVELLAKSFIPLDVLFYELFF